jgi:hypothetical protein
MSMTRKVKNLYFLILFKKIFNGGIIIILREKSFPKTPEFHVTVRRSIVIHEFTIKYAHTIKLPDDSERFIMTKKLTRIFNTIDISVKNDFLIFCTFSLIEPFRT